MNNQIFRNNIMSKHLDYSSRHHINCIRFDGKSSKDQKHENKLIEVCLFLRKSKIDYICRPIIEADYLKTEKKPQSMRWEWGTKDLIPDILAFTQPKPSVIEILNTEERDHTENKSYPDEFRVIPIGIDESVDTLEGLI